RLFAPPSLKSTVAPEPAARVRLAAVTVRVPPLPLVRTTDELPPKVLAALPRVTVPMVSLLLVDAVSLPRTGRVPPLRVTGAASLRRLPLLAPLLFSSSVPPWFRVTLAVLARAPAAPVRASVPPLTVVAPA